MMTSVPDKAIATRYRGRKQCAVRRQFCAYSSEFGEFSVSTERPVREKSMGLAIVFAVTPKGLDPDFGSRNLLRLPELAKRRQREIQQAQPRLRFHQNCSIFKSGVTAAEFRGEQAHARFVEFSATIA